MRSGTDHQRLKLLPLPVSGHDDLKHNRTSPHEPDPAALLDIPCCVVAVESQVYQVVENPPLAGRFAPVWWLLKVATD